MLQRLPADVVEMTQYGSSAAMLTLIAPTAPGATVTTAVTGPPGGPYELTVHVGPATATFTITAAGAIS